MHTKKQKFFPFYAKGKIQNSEQENPVGGRDTSNVIFARPTKSRNEGRLHNNRVGIFGTFPNSEITSVLRSVFYVNDKRYLGLNRKQMWHRSQVSGGVCRGVMGRAISPMGLLSLSLPSITFSSHQQQWQYSVLPSSSFPQSLEKISNDVTQRNQIHTPWHYIIWQLCAVIFSVHDISFNNFFS